MQKRTVCLFVAFAILLALVACRTPAGRTPSQVVDDSTITTQVTQMVNGVKKVNTERIIKPQ